MKKNQSFRKVAAVLTLLALVLMGSPKASFGMAQWQHMVPQGVLNTATQFAGLETISFAAQVQVNSTHTRYYEVQGANAERRRMLVAVDWQTGEVVRLVRLCPRYDDFETQVVIDPSDVMGICNTFLTDHGLEIPSGYSVEQEVTLHQLGPEYYYDIKYFHVVNGVPIKPDFILFEVGATYGEVITYSKVEHSLVVSTTPTIGSDEAILLARSFLGTQAWLDTTMLSPLSPALEVVYPNDYFDNWHWEWSDEQALIWNVSFPRGEGLDPVVDVWVDAHTGEIQGGEVYEYPDGHLFGVCDQIGDLNIWLEPLEEMKYDVDTTHFTNENPGLPEEVAYSIADPNNILFMLQTHGGFTGLRPRAWLGGRFADAQHLYPSDIPDNTLYWALISCCYSGASGDPDGNDFKTQFIEHGSLLFQGYLGLVNPDMYEEVEAYYLEQGWEFQNAHRMANAASPQPVVYTWSDAVPCYNHIRLAHLLVDISGPTGNVYPGDVFQMSVEVMNCEDAYEVTADDVIAYLNVPAGFTITSGVNPQDLGDLEWAGCHYWDPGFPGCAYTKIASWNVRVNSGTSAGNYVFDGIVWSDNLGVEVDDPDNPYHKYVVTVRHHHGCPYVFPWNGKEYIEDNTILSASEIAQGKGDVIDYYKLEQPLVVKDGLYSLQIREFEHEHSYFDKIELLAVDHPKDVNIGITSDGKIVTYGKATPPLSSVDDKGTDCLSLIKSIGGGSFNGHAGSHLILNFGPVGGVSNLNLVAREREKYAEMVAVEMAGSQGWVRVASLNPRQNWGTDIVDLSPFIKDLTGDLRLRLSRKSDHELDYVGLDTSEPAKVVVQSCPLKSAVHSKVGPVMKELLVGDKEYVELVPGEGIELAFSPIEQTAGYTRDFVLVSRGYYLKGGKFPPSPKTADKSSPPTSFSLSPNYPNPFNPETWIEYTLPENTHVTLKIYNVQGQLVKLLVDEYKESGHHRACWDSRDTAGEEVASGIYFYQLKAGEFVQTKRMILLR